MSRPKRSRTVLLYSDLFRRCIAKVPTGGTLLQSTLATTKLIALMTCARSAGVGWGFSLGGISLLRSIWTTLSHILRSLCKDSSSLYFSSETSPFLLASLWHDRQFLSRKGRTSF